MCSKLRDFTQLKENWCNILNRSDAIFSYFKGKELKLGQHCRIITLKNVILFIIFNKIYFRYRILSKLFNTTKILNTFKSHIIFMHIYINIMRKNAWWFKLRKIIIKADNKQYLQTKSESHPASSKNISGVLRSRINWIFFTIYLTIMNIL